MTVADLVAAELRRDGSRPFLTWYDDASGERVELSVATLANWAAKVANLLADEHGVEPGDEVALSPADHWLAVVAAVGGLTVGARLVAGDADAVVLPGEPKAFMAAVLPQPDALLIPPAPGEVAPDSGGLPRGARVLSTLPLDSAAGLDASLLVPLAAGGSVVLVANPDPAKLAARAQVERVTHTAGVDLDGLPRIG